MALANTPKHPLTHKHSELQAEDSLTEDLMLNTQTHNCFCLNGPICRPCKLKADSKPVDYEEED